jgi:hypothetical protein
MTTATLSKAKIKQAERDDARERLLSYYIKEGQTVYTSVKSVSSSGMSRTMSLYVVDGDKIQNITYYVAQALEWPLVEKNGSRVLRVGGCGMDMGFHTVYTLASVLFAGSVEGDAGYSLRHEWL